MAFVVESNERLMAAIANRVSHVKGASIPEQDADNHAACETHGWGVYDVYAEAGSASRFATKNRAEWERLLRDLEAGHFGVVVLWESSRGDRTLVSWIQFLDLCLDLRVLIYVTSEDRVYDVTKSTDYNSLAQAGINNRDESEKTSKRVNRSVRKQAAAGKPHGKIPYGYRREYTFEPDPVSGRQVRVVHQLIHDEHADVLREAARRLLAGDPLDSICRDFDERGIRSPQGVAWNGTRLRQVLLNPAIDGQRVFQGKVIGDADWPSVFEGQDVTFADVEALLTDPARRTFVDGSVKNLLTNIAECGVCGGTVRRVKSGVHSSGYTCKKGFEVFIQQALLDTFVERVVIKRLSRRDARDLFAPPTLPQTVKNARQQVKTLQQRLDGFYSSAARGGISEEGLAKIEAELLPQLEKAKRDAKAPARTALVGKLIDSGDVAARWKALTVPQRRQVIRAIVVPVVDRAEDKRRDRLDLDRVRLRDAVTGDFWAA